MDIHKPKAAHSWREFAIEIGTITCGILIALGLEQTIEQMHRRHEAELLERALQVEVRRDLGEALQQVAAFYCVRSQTANAVALMSRTGAWPGAAPFAPAGLPAQSAPVIFASYVSPDAMTVPPEPTPAPAGFSPPGGVPGVMPTPRSALMNRTWLSAASTPALLHMDQKRRDRYALLYYEIEQIESTIADGVNLRRELTALAFPQHLSAEERRHFIGLLAKVDGDNRVAYSLTGMLIAIAEKNGIRPDPRDVNDRLQSLRRSWGSCVRPFAMPTQSKVWVDKFETDRDRFSETAE